MQIRKLEIDQSISFKENSVERYKEKPDSEGSRAIEALTHAAWDWGLITAVFRRDTLQYLKLMRFSAGHHNPMHLGLPHAGDFGAFAA